MTFSRNNFRMSLNRSTLSVFISPPISIFTGPPPSRRRRRRDVRMTIVEPAVVAPRRRTDYWRHAAPDAFAQWRHVHLGNFADEAKIDRISVLVVRRKFSAAKNLRPGEAARAPAERFD